MKILIADDDIVSRKVLEIFVKELGYEVLTAADGKEAFDIWAKENPWMIITDWEMPEMDGVSLVSKIRSVQRENYCYIILVTGRDSRQDVIKGIEAGADDYITKPYDKQEFGVRIKAGVRMLNFQSKDIVIFTLAKLAESRDEDTGNHLERVRYYSKTIAETIFEQPDCPKELDRLLIENIFLTTPLHDIGKVAIPDAILLKPGRLNDAEFETMKTHAEIGYQTLNEAIQKVPRAAYLNVAADIARYHHEHYDGSGYPDGLKGNDIPLAARIFAVADVYDALVSNRPYKKAYTHERTINIIKAGSHSQFDPMVVEAFMACQRKIKEIHERFIDE